MGYVVAILIFFAQIAGVAILVGIGLLLLARTRRAAALWLLAVITRRRLPLLPEFEALGDGVLARDRIRVARATAKLRAGETLAEALAGTPGLVPDDVVLLARVGERSGRLGEAFAAEAERLARIRDASVGHSASPGILMVYLVAVPVVIPLLVTGLMIFIIPKYKKIFDDFGSRLPWMTEKLIAMSDGFAQFWFIPPVIVLWGILPAGILWFVMRTRGSTLDVPRWLTPGGRSRRTSLALRALAVPAGAGRPFEDALEPLATLAPNRWDRRRFADAYERHRAGVGVWDSLCGEGVVTRRDADLLAAAERAGNLPWALNLIADRIDDRRRRRFATLLEIAQPMLVVVLGAFVAFICIGFFLPLVQLLNDLS